MAEWETSYGGKSLNNARILTDEEIERRYPPENNTNMAKLTREFIKRGYDIVYGECLNLKYDEISCDDLMDDVIRTATYLYKTTPDNIVLGCFTDMSEKRVIYAAVKMKDMRDS